MAYTKKPSRNVPPFRMGRNLISYFYGAVAYNSECYIILSVILSSQVLQCLPQKQKQKQKPMQWHKEPGWHHKIYKLSGYSEFNINSTLTTKFTTLTYQIPLFLKNYIHKFKFKLLTLTFKILGKMGSTLMALLSSHFFFFFSLRNFLLVLFLNILQEYRKEHTL